VAVSTRYTVDRLNRKLSKAIAAASDGHLVEDYQQALAPVADDISGKIHDSGRGGDQNADFARQETRAFRAGSGRYNILFGWLNPPAEAAAKGGGGKLWYQWQDAGFHLFGGSHWIEGVGATIDRRERVIDAIDEVNRRYVGDLANILKGR
jgi:hypothetical protein